MLTPQEVSEHTFTKANFGGYSMAMVDEFLDVLTADYTALYKENAVLKSKMKVLVDKVEEYRSTEDAMRKALLTAQKMADDLVEQARVEKEAMLREAETENNAKLATIRQAVEDEQFRLTTAQNATTAYIAKLKELYQHELEYLGTLEKLNAPAAKPMDSKDRIAKEIEVSLEKRLGEDTGKMGEQPEPAAEAAKPAPGAPAGGIYDDILELTRHEIDEKVAARARAEAEEEAKLKAAEEVTGETRRVPTKEDLMDGLGFGR